MTFHRTENEFATVPSGHRTDASDVASRGFLTLEQRLAGHVGISAPAMALRQCRSDKWAVFAPMMAAR